MKPVSAPAPEESTTTPERESCRRPEESWTERAGRLYADLRLPARALVRCAYRGAFSEDEIEDVYSSAWLGTLRALSRRHEELSDEEIRSYLLTAVANQANKELRRRRRKPTASLDGIGPIPDEADTPDERAVSAERSRVTRDLLSSLPRRRRAVMLLRYGWGLEPAQVQALVADLSPRAYRKEVTRGVDELTERMRRFERGEWCADREPLLKNFAAGLADDEEERQARAHLSHCNECSDFVARLGGHLHDLGSAAAVPAVLDSVDGRISLVDRLGELKETAREAAEGVLPGGGSPHVTEAGVQLASAGGTRGAGATAGVAILGKLAGIGAAGKVAAACVAGGAAITACVTAGVVPAGIAQDESRVPTPKLAVDGKDLAAAVLPPVTIRERDPDSSPETSSPPAQTEPTPEPAPDPAPVPEATVAPVAPSTPPIQQEFGVAAATPTGGGSSGSGGGGGGGSAVGREFGP